MSATGEALPMAPAYTGIGLSAKGMETLRRNHANFTLLKEEGPVVRVKEVIDIPFAYPRPQLPEIRGDPVFQQIRATIWSLIRSPEAAH